MRHTLAALLILAFACTSATVQSGRTSDSSTADFDVVIDQANAPMTMAGHDTADVKFLITLRNTTNEPWTIERIALQSMGRGAYSMPVRTRAFDRSVAPGAEEQFEFWGTVDLAEDTILAKAPITMRAIIYAENNGVKREEEFMQRINGRVSVAMTDR